MTIEGFGQNPGTGSFTDSSGTRKQKSMREPSAENRILQRSGYSLLAHQIFKDLWPPLPCQYLVHMRL